MQVGQVRWPGLTVLLLVSLVISGCGQKGPLYRDAPAPEVEQSATAGQQDDAGQTRQDDDKPEL